MSSRLESIVIASALMCAASVAGAGGLDGKVELAFQSAYLWRGMVLNDKPVFQPSLTVSGARFSGSVWGNVDLTSDNGYRGEASEIDYWLAYSVPGEDLDWTLTYYAYTFPHTPGVSTQEVWASVTYKTAPFSPSLTAIRDVNAIKGWYFLLTGSQNLGLLRSRGTDGLVLTLNLGRGTKEYSRGYFPEIERDSVTDYGARLDLPFKVGRGTLKVEAQFTNFTDADVYSPGFEGKRANFVWGLVYSVPF